VGARGQRAYNIFMALTLRFVDKEYPYQGYSKERTAVRGLLMGSDGRFLIHEIERDDLFGHYLYFETPGGGNVLGESFLETLKREVLEETGRNVLSARYLGKALDAYNPLKQRNKTYYFFAFVSEMIEEPRIMSLGDTLIKRTLLLSIDEAIALLEDLPSDGISLEVKRRELPFWLYAQRELNGFLSGYASL